MAELAEEIDTERARAALDAAEARVAELAGSARTWRRGAGATRNRDAELVEAEAGSPPGSGPPRDGRRHLGGWRLTISPPRTVALTGRRRQPNSMALYSASLCSGWRASMSRTVPDLDRMTSDWVVAPNSS